MDRCTDAPHAGRETGKLANKSNKDLAPGAKLENPIHTENEEQLVPAKKDKAEPEP